MDVVIETFDVADYLTNNETVSAYLTDAFENDTATGIVEALLDVARARPDGLDLLAASMGMTHAEILGLVKDADTTDFATILRIVHALGFKLTALMATRSEESVAA